MRWLVVGARRLLVLVGCAKYNTYYNAKRAFDNAEHVREEAIRNHQDPPPPTGAQRADYETAIRKAQKILDEYPGHGLTDDALFLQAKAHHRLESFRMSIRNFDLLFTNFPATDYLEEALYLQALNYLLLGAVERSQEYLDRLAKLYPESHFQAETRKVPVTTRSSWRTGKTAAASYREYLELDVDRGRTRPHRPEAGRMLLGAGAIRSAAEVLSEDGRTAPRARTRRSGPTAAGAGEGPPGRFRRGLESCRTRCATEAEIYNAQGEVALVEAEGLVARGRGDEASPLLENMPAEWETPGDQVASGRSAGLSLPGAR